jgi:hypothetical protein
MLPGLVIVEILYLKYIIFKTCQNFRIKENFKIIIIYIYNKIYHHFWTEKHGSCQVNIRWEL